MHYIQRLTLKLSLINLKEGKILSPHYPWKVSSKVKREDWKRKEHQTSLSFRAQSAAKKGMHCLVFY